MIKCFKMHRGNLILRATSKESMESMCHQKSVAIISSLEGDTNKFFQLDEEKYYWTF